MLLAREWRRAEGRAAGNGAVAATPHPMVAIRAHHSCRAGSSRRPGVENSSTTTADNEFSAESIDDSAAARMPATTTPTIPVGR